ncbi:uncharacterized protein TNIN_102841 [Trichonephila inaurata madagascariensis]|uniref:Uncharacterized protein n=1 Tax=Trichonephila inaurata madagascariensis TaxID=2747483 RepID=A0A8X7CLI1_9ARAC|nr:uncharacterized protein TNIN_102841 [Trichonephila inaurata madagascariensis]
MLKECERLLSTILRNGRFVLVVNLYCVEKKFALQAEQIENRASIEPYSSKLSSSPPIFSEINMKTYFCIMIALCLVLVTVQAAEMGSRTRRQSDNLITLNIPRDLLDSLLKALLGEGGVGDLLKNILGGNGGGN